MQTAYGPEAKDGDYVIVLGVNYKGRSATNYLAKVHKGKAYTGQKMNTVKGVKYIHKLVAQVVVPADIIPEETRRKIEEDIALHH